MLDGGNYNLLCWIVFSILIAPAFELPPALAGGMKNCSSHCIGFSQIV